MRAVKALVAAGCFSKFDDVNVDIELIELVKQQYHLSSRIVLDPSEFFPGFGKLYDVALDDVDVIVYVVGIKEYYTKGNKSMAFIRVEDINGRADVTVFPANWQADSYKVGDLIAFKCGFSDRGDHGFVTRSTPVKMS